MNRQELIKKATELKIEGAFNMTKEELEMVVNKEDKLTDLIKICIELVEDLKKGYMPTARAIIIKESLEKLL